MSEHNDSISPKVCSCCGAPLNEDNVCSYCGISHDGSKKEKKSKYSVPNISDRYEPSKEAYEEIFRIMNRRRPYQAPYDFTPQSLFPDLD